MDIEPIIPDNVREFANTKNMSINTHNLFVEVEDYII